MSTPEPLTIDHHTAADVPAMRQELIDVNSDARRELLDQPFNSPERFGERLDRYIEGPGFELVTGRIDGQLAGYAFGSTLTADTKWWDPLEASSDDPDLTRETGTRTFAFREILVRKQHQRRGYAHRLHDALLSRRREERATLLVRPDNLARDLYLRWGWSMVGHLQPFPDSPRFESMILPLPR